VLKGSLRLLCGSNIENVFQLTVHLVHLINRGCGQCVQKRGRCGHVLAGYSEGGARQSLAVYGSDDIPGPSLGIGEVDCYALLYLEHGLVVV
jgi:hypothetical protein